MRRLIMGQFNTTPFLGWKEFIPNYFGPLRGTTAADQTINMVIPSMLNSMYTRPTDGKVAPKFVQDVKIEGGVMLYTE